MRNEPQLVGRAFQLVIRRIAKDEPPRFQGLPIPRDLETICRKCLEKEPESATHVVPPTYGSLEDSEAARAALEADGSSNELPNRHGRPLVIDVGRSEIVYYKVRNLQGAILAAWICQEIALCICTDVIDWRTGSV